LKKIRKIFKIHIIKFCYDNIDFDYLTHNQITNNKTHNNKIKDFKNTQAHARFYIRIISNKSSFYYN